MKKILSFAAVLSVLALVACGSSSTGSTSYSACSIKANGKVILCEKSTTSTVSADSCSKSASQSGALLAMFDTTLSLTATYTGSASNSCPSGADTTCAATDSTGKTIGSTSAYTTGLKSICSGF